MSEPYGIFPLYIGGIRDRLREHFNFLRPIVYDITYDRTIRCIHHPRFWHQFSVLVEVFDVEDFEREKLGSEDIEAEYNRRGLKFPKEYYALYFCEQHQSTPPDGKTIVFYRGRKYDSVPAISRNGARRYIGWANLVRCFSEFPESSYKIDLPRTTLFAGIRE